MTTSRTAWLLLLCCQIGCRPDWSALWPDLATPDRSGVPAPCEAGAGCLFQDLAGDRVVNSSTFAAVTLPPGGSFFSLCSAREKSNTLYLLSHGGRAFHSTDGGQKWSECTRPPGGTAESISVAPAGDSVFLSTGDEVFESRDACATWVTTGFGTFGRLAALGPGRALAAHEGAIWQLAAGAWTHVPAPTDGHQVTALVVDPTEKWIYVGTSDNGVARSRDGGKTWQKVNSGLTGSLNAWSLSVSATDPQRIFAAMNGGTFRTVTGGDTWESILALQTFAVASDFKGAVASSTGTGLRTSEDGGNSFSSTDRRGPGWDRSRASRLIFDSQVEGRLFASTDRGIFMTPDRSWLWTEIDRGLSAWLIFGIAAPSHTPGLIYLASYGGLLRSTDDGATWTVQSKGFVEISRTWNLALDPVDPDALFVAGEGIFLSTNRGDSLSRLYATGTADGYHATVALANPPRIYFGTGKRLVVSTDTARTWQPRLIAGVERYVNDLLLLGPSLLVATSSGLFSTDDDGVTFNKVTRAPAGECLALLAAADGRLFLGMNDGVYSAATASDAWLQAGLNGAVVRDLLASGQHVIAATDGGVFQSVGGGPFTEMAGLADKRPRSLALDQRGRLLVGTYGHGLFRTDLVGAGN